MAGKWYDWMNEDSASDKLLVELIGIARKLARLPTSEDIPEARRQYLMGSIPIYFGTFEAALEKVASLLYGNRLATSPYKLTPREEGLSEAKKSEILEQRQQHYRKFLRKLDELGSLKAIRREQEDELRRRQLEKEAEGYRVTKIPRMSVRELNELHEGKAFIDSSGTRRGKIEFEKESARSNGGMRRKRWGYSRADLGSASEPASRLLNVKTGGIQKSIPSFRKETENISSRIVEVKSQQRLAACDAQKSQGGVDKMGRGPNVKKEDVLRALWDIYKTRRVIPSWGALNEYRKMYPEKRIPYAAAFGKLLGDKETWLDQVLAYAKENGLMAELAPEQVDHGGGFTGELESSELEDAPASDGKTESSEVGDEMSVTDGEAVAVSDDKALEASGADHPKPLEAEKADMPEPGDGADGAAWEEWAKREKATLEPYCEAVVDGPKDGGEGVDDATGTKSNEVGNKHVGRLSDEEVDVAIAAVLGNKKTEEVEALPDDAAEPDVPQASNLPDDTVKPDVQQAPTLPDDTTKPDAQQAEKPAARKKKLKMNILGVTLRYLIDGEECELELEFGPPS